MRAIVVGVILVGLCVAAAAQNMSYPPYPAGMRLIVGSSGVIVRNTPSLSGTCGTPAHECTAADAQLPNTYGVVQTDPPVLDPSGFYWVKMQFDSGVSGWSSGYPPYLVALSPPQMIQGANFSIAGDYNGPAITQAVCIIDGVNSAAVLNLQPTSGGQQGTLICAVAAPAVGNHKAVIRTENNAGSAASPEFQYAVTSAPIPQPPNAPSNLRITPVGK